MSIKTSYSDFYKKYSNLRSDKYLTGNIKLEIPAELFGKKTEGKDLLNQTVKPGDMVAYCIGNSLYSAVLIGFTDEGFRLAPFSRYKSYPTISSASLARPDIILVKTIEA